MFEQDSACPKCPVPKCPGFHVFLGHPGTHVSVSTLPEVLYANFSIKIPWAFWDIVGLLTTRLDRHGTFPSGSGTSAAPTLEMRYRPRATWFPQQGDRIASRPRKCYCSIVKELDHIHT